MPLHRVKPMYYVASHALSVCKGDPVSPKIARNSIIMNNLIFLNIVF